MARTLCTITLLLASFAGAQELPTNDALRSAIAVEELEHDSAGARARYQAIVADTALPDAVRRHAWLRLGMLARTAGDEATATHSLERAAVGDDAIAKRARAIAKQEPQDPERLRKLAEGAKTAVEDFVAKPNDQRLFTNVVWFGDAAVAALVRQLRAFDGRSWPTRDAIVRALWTMDSERARVFLAEELAQDDVDRRRIITRSDGVSGALGFSPSGKESRAFVRPDRTELVKTALADPDATVVASTLTALGRALDPEVVCGLVLDARPEVRSAATQVLPSLWEFNRSPAVAAKLAAVLPRAFEATSPEEFAAAVTSFQQVALFSTASRTAFLRALPRLGRDARPPMWCDEPSFDGDHENAELIAEQLERIGDRGHDSAEPQRSLETVISFYMGRAAWGPAAMDTVLRAARGGYVLDHVGNWMLRHATSADIGRVLEALGDTPALMPVSPWLASQNPPERFAEPLRLALDRAMIAGSNQKWAPTALLLAFARTGSPLVAPYLRALYEKPDKSVDGDTFAHAVLWYGARRNEPESRTLLRGMLRTEWISVRARAALFGQLVRMGDLAIWDQVDELRELLARESVTIRHTLPDGEPFDPRSQIGFDDWLTLQSLKGGESSWWHGYDATALTTIWARLLAPRDDGGNDANFRMRTPIHEWLEAPARVPGPVVIAIAKGYLVRCRRARDFAADKSGIGTLLWAASNREAGDPAVREALAALREAAFSSPSASVREQVLFTLPETLDGPTLDRVRPMVGDSAIRVALRAWRKLEALGVPITRDLIQRGLASSDEDVRLQALERAGRCTEPIVDLVATLLHDEEEGPRVAACQFLAARVDYESVPALLETLKDPEESVRRAAADALQAIRLYHDEKSRWARVLGGKAQLGPAAAAEALIDQADPKNDRETRLLAIRSLGVLGAPEPLPLLIGWTKDPDTDVAQAAREAIQQIHARAK